MVELDEKTPLFTIGVVEELTGLTKRQIRYYDKLGLVIPDRTKGNKRRYSLNELNELLTIKDRLNNGESIEQIKKDYKNNEQIRHNKINKLEDEREINLYAPSYLDVMLDELTKEKRRG